MTTATIPRPRNTGRRKCVPAIMDLMADYQPRTSDQIAELTGFTPGSVRKALAEVLNYGTERKRGPRGTVQTYYFLRKHK